MTEPPVISASGELLYIRAAPLFEEDELYGWFGRYLCDALMGMLQGLDQIVIDQIIDGVAYPGWCTILAPAVCPDPWLDWDGALYGVILPPGASPPVKRSTIEELPPQKRGGIEAMRKAAEATLIGTKAVTLTEGAEGNAYLILATTRTAETPNTEATHAALLSQKPGGVKLVYSLADTPLWDEGTLAWDEIASGVTWNNMKMGDI